MGKNNREVNGRRRPVAAGVGLVMSVALLVGSLAPTAGAASVDAGFDISGDRVAGSTISFTDRSAGGPKWVYWTFGDGRSARSANTTHTYARAGTYEIRYIVCATSTDCDTERRTITVAAASSPTRPDVRFTVSGNLVAGSPVTFTDQTAGPIGWVYWTFGDGTSSRTQDSVTHTFARPGTYDVRYLVCASSDRCGGQVQEITIASSTGPGPGSGVPVSDFTYSGLGDQASSNVAGTPIQFSDRSTGSVRGVYWTFGDLANSREPDTTHTYASPGRYRVRYTVCDNGPRCDTKTRWIEVGSADGSVTPPATDDPTPNDPGPGSGVSATSTILANNFSNPVWSPDGSLLAMWRFDTNRSEVQVFDRNDPARPAFRFVGDGGVNDVAWSPDSRRLAGIGRADSSRIWSLDDPADVTVLEAFDRYGGSIAWSPDGTRVVTTGESFGSNRFARVWDLNRLDSPEAFLPDSSSGGGPKWSRDGSLLLTQGVHGGARVWNPADWSEPVAIIKDPRSRILDAELSPDGTRVATRSSDNQVRFWDVANPSVAVQLRTPGGAARSIDWSPDGARVVSGTRDGTILVWNVSDPANPQVLTGHTKDVAVARWSPDGSVLASGSDDATVRLWDLANPANPTVLTGHTGDIYDLQWSPDGTHFATLGSDDKTTRLWTVD